jgi:hypothetical protein
MLKQDRTETPRMFLPERCFAILKNGVRAVFENRETFSFSVSPRSDSVFSSEAGGKSYCEGGLVI